MEHTLRGVVVSVLIARDPADLRSAAVPEAGVTFEGFEGDRHAGLTMRTGGRHPHYPRGTEIRNTRQISNRVSRRDGRSRLRARRAGAVPGVAWREPSAERIPALLTLPPAPGCTFHTARCWWLRAKIIPAPKRADRSSRRIRTSRGWRVFPKAALHRRGVVAWVERPGTIMPGDDLIAELPEQRIYELI